MRNYPSQVKLEYLPSSSTLKLISTVLLIHEEEVLDNQGHAGLVHLAVVVVLAVLRNVEELMLRKLNVLLLQHNHAGQQLQKLHLLQLHNVVQQLQKLHPLLYYLVQQRQALNLLLPCHVVQQLQELHPICLHYLVQQLHKLHHLQHTVYQLQQLMKVY